MNRPMGSIWTKADFHVHTPYSALNNNFGDDFDIYVKKLFTAAIEKKVNIIGITDYFTIEGYKKIKQDYIDKSEKLSELFTPEEIKKIKDILIVPNIEFRLNKIIQINKYKDGKITHSESGRINIHVIFSNDVPINRIEENFLHDLDFIYESDPNEPDKKKKLKVPNLIDLGTKLRREQPKLSGSELQIGMTNAVVDDSEISKILNSNNDFKDKYLIVIAADEDLSEISWMSQEHQTRKVLLSKSHAFFSSNPNTIKFGLGFKSDSIAEFEKEFKSLKPCIWGSDAHDYNKLFEPDKARYCWVKSDPTFEGIRQILFEPEERVFIGLYPELFSRMKLAKGKYIQSISIEPNENYDGKKGKWFKDFKIPIGLELCVIIGNKGKGKSALADIIALLGNAHLNPKDFSFLNSDKFCQKGYAENFIGTLTWFDGSKNVRTLNSSIDTSDTEKVKYIPQAYLEKLCNDEESKFKDEINKVVFSRLDNTDKLGKTSFLELEQYSSELINEQIESLLTSIGNINKNIFYLKGKLSPEYRKKIENGKQSKDKELEFHNSNKDKIVVVVNPEKNVDLSDDQRQKAQQAAKILDQITSLENEVEVENLLLKNLKIQHAELNALIQEIEYHVERLNQWKIEKTHNFSKYGFQIDNVFRVSTEISGIQLLIKDVEGKIIALQTRLSATSTLPITQEEQSLVVQLEKLNKDRQLIEEELEKPYKDYQNYLTELKKWEAKEKEIQGNEDAGDTLKYYITELHYIDNILKPSLEEEESKRYKISIDIFKLKKQIQSIYNKMKGAITDVLLEYTEEQNISIETAFKIDRIFFNRFFDYVNRYGAFYQNGDDLLWSIVGKYNFNSEEGIKGFISEISSSDIRFKEGREVDFYNYICSLEFLKPEYDLRLNDKSLSQLSPGEKGGLLLVFYLVLDKDNKPLIIDQPEDNLDNQSVAEILVPYIKRAKKFRQIIMVTHNPNLAIVSDAEQVIFMDIDKERNYVVSFDAGAIEKQSINKQIVNILEGKMKAFDNRRVKYRKNS